MSVTAVTRQVRKRKANAQDSEASGSAALFDELGNGISRAVNERNFDKPENADVDSEFEKEQVESGPFDRQEEEEEEESDEDEEIGSEVAALEFSGEDEEDVESQDAYSDDEHEGRSNFTKNYTITQDANGNPRYVYREIVPGYDSDDSDAPVAQNTIGNIPLSLYESYPHIGYDIDGKKVMRPAKGAALDSLLDSIDIPKGWTGLTDPATGKPMTLNDEELEVLKRVTRNEILDDGYDPYPDMVEYFTGKVEPMPISAAPEPKRRFVPSKHEAKRVMKLVKAIKEGRIQPYKSPSEDEDEQQQATNYDIWADEAPRPDHPMNMPAPKLPPPTYDESYHPPPEYLPDESEKKQWHESDAEDRDKEYLPTDHDALRKVPGYDQFVKEKFERCLDLYLAPRVRRNKLNIDPESLLPKLPNPAELRPYPAYCDLIFRGHNGRVRSVAIDPLGSLLATGGDDGTLRIWLLKNAREIWRVQMSNHEAINVVKWRPGRESTILAVSAGESVFLVAPPIPALLGQSSEDSMASRELLTTGWVSNGVDNAQANTNGKTNSTQWVRPETRLQEQGVMVQINVRSTVKSITWHRRGEYFATVSPQGQSSAVAIHTLSKHQTQLPFRKLKGLAQSAQFHPLKPIFFVATQRTIRSYDLVQQELLKVLQPGARWISDFDVHPGGDNVIIGSFDKRLLWVDMDLSTRPYKTLRFHTKAVRSVKFHQGGYPLFADASDDGSVQIFHGKVVGDLMENATIAPLKQLKGHSISKGLGVLDIDWHPTDPYCVSAGADGTCRLWRP